MAPHRSLPNIIVTGTPGVGKSSIARQVSEQTGLTWYDVSKLAVDGGMVEDFDENYTCPVIDEDKVLEFLKPRVSQGGCILDFYSGDLFSKKLIDIVFVVRTENKILYDRLTARGYTDVKLSDNLEYEMYGMALEDARELYDPQIVHEVENNNQAQLEDVVKRICGWVQQWQNDNK